LSKILAGLTVACIGDVTAATAAEYGLTINIQPAEFNVKELAQAIADYYSA